MTQAELWQLQLLAVSNSIGGMGVLLTMLSGYLLTAYFVGHRLGRFQAALVSTFFVLGAGLGAFMTLVQLRRALYFIEQLGSQFDVRSYVPNTFMTYFGGTLLCLLVPAALLFMYQIRRNPTLGAGKGHAGSNQGRRYFD
jgi:hypothetical protein